ncbi:YheV family putative zinc ribbon protein [Echinimonas agarilytica]|uniref:YheV family putative metal-binding protein n=1 Tax=Echinimonas agarilytica TaxID=1215918 RepID=A0AA41W3Y9_9GAMM|nr:YheV family putative zinc ribbon protein [Echinimonas agarilytica]MCM2678390.1 YheV family putative metal-binding protein [Echinimonas agarilytica]
MLKRRFIAGATCPKCNAQDTLALVATDDSSYVECVDCGHVQHEPAGESGTPGLIATFDPNVDS